MIASTNEILPGNITTVMIDTNQPPISNYYSIRPGHEGLIATLPKNEGQMTKDERLKFLVAVSPSFFEVKKIKKY
jgi:hypothetical protein